MTGRILMSEIINKEDKPVDGDLLCEQGKEKIFKGGGWVESGRLCVDSDSGNTYQTISEDGLSIGLSSDIELPQPDGGGAGRLTCCRYILGAPFGSVRLYNSCAGCKTVTISYGSGDIRDYSVQGNSHYDVILVHPNSQLAGERDC